MKAQRLNQQQNPQPPRNNRTQVQVTREPEPQTPDPKLQRTQPQLPPAAAVIRPAILPNDVSVIFGRKGQGKSKRAMWIFDNQRTRRKIILNSKPDGDLLLKWPERTNRIDGPPKDGITHIARYVPKADAMTGWDDIMSKWRYGNVLFYFDELPNHADAHQWPDELQKIYQTGRSFGCGAIACAQRPVAVPNFAISEADHVFVFYTQLKSDREKLEGATGVNWDFIRYLDPYHCGYYSQRLGMRQPVVLEPVPLI